jgi:predicted transcriptional regulator
MNTLREARKRQGLTQTELSRLTGIYQPNLQVIEAGKVIAQRKSRARIEKVLGKLDWVGTSSVKIRTGDFVKAEKQLKRLLSMFIAMSEQEKSEFMAIITKCFKAQ